MYIHVYQCACVINCTDVHIPFCTYTSFLHLHRENRGEMATFLQIVLFILPLCGLSMAPRYLQSSGTVSIYNPPLYEVLITVYVCISICLCVMVHPSCTIIHIMS